MSTASRRGLHSHNVAADAAAPLYVYPPRGLPRGCSIRSQRNDDGHRTEIIYPTGRVVRLNPDGLGRLTRAHKETGPFGAQDYVRDGQYYPSGALKQFDYGNGLTLNRTLDLRLLTQRQHITGGGAVMDLDYYYDLNARVTSHIDNLDANETRLYGYDGAGRLTSATGPWNDDGTNTAATYTYDALGNITSKLMANRDVGFSYDSNNRLTQTTDSGVWNGLNSGTRDFSYDARGNVTAIESMSFTYDHSDQPTAVSGTHNGNSISGTYVYDGNLKRVKADVDGTVIYSVYGADGSLIHSHNVTAGEKTDYIPGPAGMAARVKRVGTGPGTTESTTFLHNDHLGSASAATDITGTVLWTESYTPYGESLINNAANDNQPGFTGHVKDKATGLNYMQARYYDPVAPRFLSIDPMDFMSTGDPRMFNRYAYSFNDPINLIDPDGNRPQEPPQTSFSHKVKVAFRGVKDVVGHSLAGLSPHASYNPSGLVPILNQGDAQAYAIGATAALGASMLGPGDEAMATSTLTRAAKVGCCFVAGTLVETEDGLRPIEEVEIGDLVLSRNPETGETAFKTVTDFIPRHQRVIWEVRLSDNQGNFEAFETTDEHPWWIVDADGLGSWKRTDELAAGMTVTTADNRLMVISFVKVTNRVDGTYNITVADFETYFVGENKVLVHNCNLPFVKKAVNSNMAHATERAVERGVFSDAKAAQAGLKDLSSSIKKDGFPTGSIPDTANAGRVLVPVGNNGMAAYQVGKNGTAKLKTVLKKRDD